jgi:iron(III) transport system substrate-binding protein
MSKPFALSSLAFAAVLAAQPALAEGVVNVYSYRQPQLVEPLFKVFQEKTGVEVKMVFAEKGLIERLEQEGNLSPADVLMTADIGRLVEAADKGLAQPIGSAVVADKVPTSLRSPKDEWAALTMRARVIYASKDRVTEDKLGYEDLADPKFKGKVCTRPGDHPYNLGLIAAVIAKKGEAEARKWVEGLRANLAGKPVANDRAVAKGIFAGECDIGVANSYYMGLMINNEKETEQKDWAKAVKVIFPASDAMGTHVNVSGALITKNAPNKDNAVKLMEFLVSDEAQTVYSAANYEHPANPQVKPIELVASWGTLTPDSVNVEDIAKNLKLAAQIVVDTGYND